MAPRREDLGSWLEGTPAGGAGEEGSTLGLPARGPGSRATLGRRLAGVALDWTLCMAISAAFFPSDRPAALPILAGDPMATLGIFAVSTTVLVGLLGHSIGHRLLGLQVVRLADLPARRAGASRDGGLLRPPGLVTGAIRTILLCLAIPAVIWDSSGRGMHDVAARTVLVRR
jgi:hypothetical protein